MGGLWSESGNDCWRWWRCRGDDRRGYWLDDEIVDYGLDAVDLRGIGGGERARGFTADGAVECGNTILDGRLDGFAAECGVSGEAGLEGRAHGCII